MIYRYEKEIVNYFKEAVPEITQISYALTTDFNILLEPHIKFPLVYFYRESQPWVHKKKIVIRDESMKEYEFYQIDEQMYEMFILVEKHIDAQRMARDLNYKFRNKPYVNVKWSRNLDPIEIQLRFLYIKLEELRSSTDNKGSVRIVKVGWKSSLFMKTDFEFKPISGFKIIVKNNKNEIIEVYE